MKHVSYFFDEQITKVFIFGHGHLGMGRKLAIISIVA